MNRKIYKQNKEEIEIFIKLIDIRINNENIASEGKGCHANAFNYQIFIQNIQFLYDIVNFSRGNCGKDEEL